MTARAKKVIEAEPKVGLGTLQKVFRRDPKKDGPLPVLSEKGKKKKAVPEKRARHKKTPR